MLSKQEMGVCAVRRQRAQRGATVADHPLSLLLPAARVSAAGCCAATGA
jgi:hypothetical protein